MRKVSSMYRSQGERGPGISRPDLISLVEINHLHIRLLRFKILTNTSNAPPRADTMNEDVNLAASLSKYLRTGVLLVCLWVFLVLQLIEVVVVWLRTKLFNVLEPTRRAERRVEQVDVRAKKATGHKPLMHGRDLTIECQCQESSKSCNPFCGGSREQPPVASR